MTLGELFERMTVFELMLWKARQGHDPLPDPWLQTGKICAATVNVWNSKRMVKPEEFIPQYVRKEPMSTKQLMNAVAASFPVVIVKG